MKRIILPISLLALSAVAFAHPHKSDEANEESQVQRVWPFFGDKAKSQKDTSNTKAKKELKKVIRIDRKKDEAKKKAKSYGSADAMDDATGDMMDAEEFGARLEKRFERHAKNMERKLDNAKSRNKCLKDDREIETVEDIRDAAKAIENLLADSGVISGLADMVLDLADDFDIESSEDGLSLNFEGKRLGRLKVDKDTDESFDIEGFGRNLTIDKKVIRKNGKTKTRIIIEMDGDEEFDIDLTPKR